MEREFVKKEFNAWFKQLEKIAKDEYRIGNLNKEEFIKSYTKGLSINQSIENFLNS